MAKLDETYKLKFPYNLLGSIKCKEETLCNPDKTQYAVELHLSFVPNFLGKLLGF